MSKRAEEFASEAYPLEVFKGSMCDRFRSLIALGYEQAEKDLALTWEDVNLIDSILVDLQDEGVERYGGLRQYYEEALKRFNEQRKK